MCLTTKQKKPELAKRNIKVYKHLGLLSATNRFTKEITSKHDGWEFRGFIKNTNVSGKVSIEDRLYFCTNVRLLNGVTCNDKKGYTYSWVMDDKVQYIELKNPKAEKFIPFTPPIEYVTPYFGFRVKIPGSYTSKLILHGDEVNIGLHSFADKNSCILHSEFVVECIIPKGSYYYKGTYDGSVSYASDKLEYIKLIK